MKKFRVAEIFGPTIQGEGRNVGIPCHFVRFGGCDFRCVWCDTPHAVLPDLVSKLQQMSAGEIFNTVNDLEKKESHVTSNVSWVVLTGGNPALLDLEELIDTFHRYSWQVMLETQGSVFREWFGKVDDLCFSPKPPSAGNITDLTTLKEIVYRTFQMMSKHIINQGPNPKHIPNDPYLKIPIFSEDDLDYAEEVVGMFDLEVFLSIGNDDPSLPTVSNPHPVAKSLPYQTADKILDNFKYVLEHVLQGRPKLQGCRIFPQQHVLLWGNERGH